MTGWPKGHPKVPRPPGRTPWAAPPPPPEPPPPEPSVWRLGRVVVVRKPHRPGERVRRWTIYVTREDNR